jgi:hypothetical protein
MTREQLTLRAAKIVDSMDDLTSEQAKAVLEQAMLFAQYFRPSAAAYSCPSQSWPFRTGALNLERLAQSRESSGTEGTTGEHPRR